MVVASVAAMHLIRSALALTSSAIIVVVSTAACSQSAATPTSPSSISGSQDLTAEQFGGAWRLTSMQPVGQAELTVPAGATYDLTLADGRLSTRVDCNLCTGRYTLAGDLFTAGPALACTRAACPTMAFESTYTAMLEGESRVALSGASMTLTSPRGILRFTR